MTEDVHWFVLKAISREWGCSILETRFAVHDLAKLQSICGPDGHRYFLLEDEVANEIAAAFHILMPCNDCDYRLAEWKPNVVPYLIHTNFELPLMLDGRKPLAVFWDAYPPDLLGKLTAPFAPYVASGQIVSCIVEKPEPEPKRGPTGEFYHGTTIAFFAMPGEAWRIDAYQRLREEAALSVWNDDFERREGRLYGYTESQIDWWIANKHKSNPWQQ